MGAGAEGLRKRLVEEGRAHMQRLETLRGLYIKCGALGTAQRALLYAKDELGMCHMRMRVSPFSSASASTTVFYGSLVEGNRVHNVGIQLANPNCLLAELFRTKAV